ncbi:calcium-binding protein [Microvirga sp. TS319]|uniref:calcium-binding protein n=1 Tax=Microvirga sp. TS319 TaxID=3241165 RepID=UPI00351A9952
MAVVTFHRSMPAGLRLQDFFKPVLGAVVFAQQGERWTASFQVNVSNAPLAVVYEGAALSNEFGDVSSLRFGPSASPWLSFGEMGGPTLFTYDDLAAFHRQGAQAAALIMAGSDTLYGSSHGDYLEGYAGDDLLDGQEGADTLVGGAGNDTYIVDNKEDRVLEAIGGGYDVVQTSVSFALAADSEVEVLKATPSARSLTLTGNTFRNQIIGTPGNDVLDGKGGIDTLIGGAGDDTYLVDNALDVVLEYAGGGRDTVIAQSSYQLSDHLEILKAGPGSARLTLTGNAQSNEIYGNAGSNIIRGQDGNDKLYGDGGNDTIDGGNGNDVIYGGIGNDRLDGGAGNDKLYGDVGNDILNGGSGNDTLYGGPGHDSLNGGDGNDTIYGDVGNDTILGGNGNDRIYGGTGDNKLSGGAGNDTLYGGMDRDTLSGGDGNDRLYGDAGNDYLNGGAGLNTLSGGWGRDTFVFNTALDGKRNVTTITDFNVADDTIRLENAIFKKLTKTGVLNENSFIIGSKAQDKNDYIIYNRKTGYLFYDPDGSGSSSPILFAKLKPGLALTHNDFIVI